MRSLGMVTVYTLVEVKASMLAESTNKGATVTVTAEPVEYSTHTVPNELAEELLKKMEEK